MAAQCRLQSRDPGACFACFPSRQTPVCRLCPVSVRLLFRVLSVPLFASPATLPFCGAHWKRSMRPQAAAVRFRERSCSSMHHWGQAPRGRWRSCSSRRARRRRSAYAPASTSQVSSAKRSLHVFSHAAAVHTYKLCHASHRELTPAFALLSLAATSRSSKS